MNPMSEKFAELFEEEGLNRADLREKIAAEREDAARPAHGVRKVMPSHYEHSLDLHGATVADTPDLVRNYLNRQRGLGRRFVLITFGMGRHSPEGKSKLRPVVIQTLREMVDHQRVRSFKTALPKDGGMGSVYVYF